MPSNNASPLAAFATLSAAPRKGCCARCTKSYDVDNGARAAVNADLYSRPVGADKQARIAHNSQTVCEACAVEMWAAIQALYDFGAFQAAQAKAVAAQARADRKAAKELRDEEKRLLALALSAEELAKADAVIAASNAS